MAPRNKQKKEKKEPEKKKKNEDLSMANSSSGKESKGKAISLQENKISEAQKNRGEILVKKPPEIPRKILQSSTDEAPASSKKKNGELVKDSSSQRKFKGGAFLVRENVDECQSTAVSSISNIKENYPVNTETRTGDGNEISIEENFPDEETQQLLKNLELETKEKMQETMDILRAVYGEKKLQREYEEFIRNKKIVETKRKFLHDLSVSDEPSTSQETRNKEGDSLPDENSNLELLRQKVKRIGNSRGGQKATQQVIERHVDKSKNSNESKRKQLKQKEEDPGKKDDASRQSSPVMFWLNARGLKISEECSSFQSADDLAKSLLNLNVHLDAVAKKSEFLLSQPVHKASEGKGVRKNVFPAIATGETSKEGSKEQECTLSEAEIDKMIGELIWIGSMMSSKSKDVGGNEEPKA